MSSFLINMNDDPTRIPSTMMLKPKIRRMRLSNEQVDLLNDVFEKDQNPSMESRTALASQLNMETKQVSSWFQNRRQKLKIQSAFPNVPAGAIDIEPTRNPSAPATTIADSDEYESVYNHTDSRSVSPVLKTERALSPPLSYHSPSPLLPPLTTLTAPSPNRVPLTHQLQLPPPLPQSHYQHHQHRQQRQLSDMQSTFQVPHPQLPPPPSVRPRSRHSPSPSDNDYHRTSLHPPRTSTRARTARLMSGPMPLTTVDPIASPASTRFRAASPLTHTHGHSRHSSASSNDYLHPSDAHHHTLVVSAPPAQPHLPPPIVVSPLVDTTTGQPHRWPVSPPNPRKHKSRKRMEPWQKKPLMEIWARTQRPSMELRQQVAADYGMTTSKVTNWFRNLRQAVRKKGLDAVMAQEAMEAHEDHDEEHEHEHDLHSEGEESDEVITPYASPETRIEHDFGTPSPRLTEKHISTMEAADLLLFFSKGQAGQKK